jgi:hypothetical protein
VKRTSNEGRESRSGSPHYASRTFLGYAGEKYAGWEFGQGREEQWVNWEDTHLRIATVGTTGASTCSLFLVSTGRAVAE